MTYYEVCGEGARIRGSVFSIIFLFYAEEFESKETSPGFARYLELRTLGLNTAYLLTPDFFRKIVLFTFKHSHLTINFFQHS